MKKAYWCENESVFDGVQCSVQFMFGITWGGQTGYFKNQFVGPSWVIVDSETKKMTWTLGVPIDVAPENRFNATNKDSS